MEGRHWVARTELDDRTLTLHGRDLPVESVELVRVIDLEPYIQGQRRLQEAWARHYYHALQSATGRNPRQRFPLVSADSRGSDLQPVATGCSHRAP